MGTPSQTYGTSLAIWDHTVLLCLPPDTSEHTPPNPSHACWYSIYLPRRDGRLSWPSWLDSASAGSRTSDLWITSPTPNRCTTKTTTFWCSLFKVSLDGSDSIMMIDWLIDTVTFCSMVEASYHGWQYWWHHSIETKTQNWLDRHSDNR